MKIRHASIAFSIAFDPLKLIKSLKIKEHALLHHGCVLRKIVTLHIEALGRSSAIKFIKNRWLLCFPRLRISPCLFAKERPKPKIRYRFGALAQYDVLHRPEPILGRPRAVRCVSQHFA